MKGLPETFFVQKIEQGGSRLVNERDRELLLTPVVEAIQLMTRDEGMSLQLRCSANLTRAYRSDTEGRNREAAFKWREANIALYGSSIRLVSGIVQNWYLSEGRRLERHVFGPPPWILWLALVLALAGLLTLSQVLGC